MILLLVVLLSLASATIADEPVIALNKDGASAEVYFIQGRWQKAIEGYNALSDPSYGELLNLADAYIYSGDYKAAGQTLNRAVVLKDTPDARISLAMLKAIDKKKYIKELEAMLEVYGDNPRLWRAIGIVQTKHGFDKKALDYFYTAIEKDPMDYISYFYLGTLYEIHYAFDDAITVYKRAVQINPNYAQALNNLGYCYKERHYYAYAIEMYKKAIGVDPENSGFYYNIGNAYTHKVMIKEAYDSYKKALELEPTFAKAHYNMGKTYIRLERFQEAVEHLKLYVKYWDPSVSEIDAPHPDKVKEEIEELEELIKYEDNDKDKTR